MISDVALDPETRRVLGQFGFDRETFERLRRRLRDGGDALDNVVRGRIEAPGDEDVVPLPPPGSPGRRSLAERGWQALADGQVGAVVLAGGMATRFGGVVKAAAEVLPGCSFLDVKIADVRNVARTSGGRVPVLLMASFATDERLRELASAAQSPEAPIEVFHQFVSMRLTPRGEPFIGADGRPSLYATGHGDLTFALRSSGLLDEFRSRGGRMLFVSNVDNAAATLDPAVIGAHLAGGRGMTVEVVRKAPGDRGGAPARVNGLVQIVEAFRFPEGFDQDAIPVFNTNTLVLDADAVDRDFPLSWFHVRKSIAGRDAVQFERLVGEVSAFVPAQFLAVERDGLDGRFQPAKEPEELQQRRGEIERILAHRQVL